MLGVEIPIGADVWINCPKRVTNWYGHLSLERILDAILTVC